MCESKTTCQVCRDPYSLKHMTSYVDKCVADCGVKHYKLPERICVKCHPLCMTCFADGSNKCPVCDSASGVIKVAQNTCGCDNYYVENPKTNLCSRILFILFI